MKGKFTVTNFIERTKAGHHASQQKPKERKKDWAERDRDKETKRQRDRETETETEKETTAEGSSE